MQRDVPPPAPLVGRLHDQRGALVAVVVLGRALVVGPDRALVEQRIPDAQAVAVHQHRRLAAGVDDHRRPHLAPRAVRLLDLHADGALALEDHLEHVHALAGVDAVLARVLEQHLVELAALDLPRLRALVRLVVPEVERRRQLAVGADELHAALLDEVAALHLVQHVEPLQHPVGLGDERLADVEAREGLALEQLDAAPVLGEQRRDGGTGRSAADDDDVGRRGGHCTHDSDLDEREHFDDVADDAVVEQHLGAPAVERARLAHPEDAHHLGVRRRPRRTRAARS